jgi:hypothetical protein
LYRLINQTPSAADLKSASTGLLSTLLFLVVVAILLPAVFDLTERLPHARSTSP